MIAASTTPARRASPYERFLHWREVRLNMIDVENGGHDMDTQAAVAIRKRIANGWPFGKQILGVK